MDQTNFQDLIKKVEEMKKTGQVDLSSDEDLSIAVMNLISLEEHFYFSGEKAKKPEYFDFLNEIREIRKKLLAKLIDKHEAESWCISKHLLATTMRLMEVGTKALSDGKKDEAKELFDQAYKLYSMFWGLRLKIINTADIKKTASEDSLDAARDNKPWNLNDIVDKLVDCCDE